MEKKSGYKEMTKEKQGSGTYVAKTEEEDAPQKARPRRGSQKKGGSFGDLVPQILAAFAVAFGSAVIGFSGAFTSPALPQMKSSFLKITEEEGSWIGSLMPLSAMFGGMFGGTLIEKLGRKTTLIGCAIPCIVCYLLIAFAQDVLMVYAGRAINGLCVGVLSLATPVFLGEVIEPKIRGTMGVLPATFGNSAMLVCFVAGMYIDWNSLALIGACLPIPYFILMLFVPETPRWYLAKGQKKAAFQALRKLRGPKADIVTELTAIERNIQETNRNVAGFRDLLNKAYLKALFISFGLMLFQQLSGINAVISYTVEIFRFAGSTIQENIASCIVGAVNILATMTTNVLIDRVGRKVLLIFSGVVMSVTLIVFGVYFHLKILYGAEFMEGFGWLPLVCLVVYVISFSLGFGPIPWLMIGEIFPNKIRGMAASMATTFNWSTSFIVTKTFHQMKSDLGINGAFYLYGCICVLAVVFSVIFVPETKGKSLEEIENVLGVRQSIRRKVKPPSKKEVSKV